MELDLKKRAFETQMRTILACPASDMGPISKWTPRTGWERLAATGITKALLYWEALAAVNWKLWKVTVVRKTLPAYKRAHGSQAACRTDALPRDFSKI